MKDIFELEYRGNGNFVMNMVFIRPGRDFDGTAVPIFDQHDLDGSIMDWIIDSEAPYIRTNLIDDLDGEFRRQYQDAMDEYERWS